MREKLGNLIDRSNAILILLGVYVFLTTFSNTAWYSLSEGMIFYKIIKIIRYIIYLMFVMLIFYKMIKNKYSKESILYLFLLGVLSIIGFKTGNDKSLFFTILFWAAMFGLNSNKVFTCSLFVQGGLLIVTILCAFLGLADNSLLDVERARYSLGFNWANLSPILYLFVALQYIYKRKDKITIIECLVLEIINVFLYKFTNTKMSFFVLTAIIAVMFIYKLFSRFKGVLKKVLISCKNLVIILPAICAFVACWLPVYNVDTWFWQKLNSLLSGRLWQCRNAIFKYGITLFGKEIDVKVYSVVNKGQSDQSFFIDSGYLHFAVKYGIIVLILLVALYSICIWKAYKKEDYFMVCIFIVVSIFCIEDLYFVSAFNIFTIYAFCDEDVFSDVSVLKKLSKPLYAISNNIDRRKKRA